VVSFSKISAVTGRGFSHATLTVVSAEHPANASVPIEATELGI